MNKSRGGGKQRRRPKPAGGRENMKKISGRCERKEPRQRTKWESLVGREGGGVGGVEERDFLPGSGLRK